MAQAAAPIAIASLLMHGGAMRMSHKAQKTAGQIESMEAETMARQEELGAIQREADRKHRLARALSSQIASAGAKGIAAFEGSPLALLEEDIKREETATERDVFQTKLSAMTLRTRGRIRERLGKAGLAQQQLSNIGVLGAQAAQVAQTL